MPSRTSDDRSAEEQERDLKQRDYIAKIKRRERLDGCLESVWLKYQLLAHLAEEGTTEQQEFERQRRVYVDIQKDIDALSPEEQYAVLAEAPQLVARLRSEHDLVTRDRSLTPEQLERAVQARLADLTPLTAPDRSPGERPRVVFIAGQPGVGKTTTQKFVRSELGGSRIALYDGDDNAKVHPHYEAIAREYEFDGHHIADRQLPDDARKRYLDHLRGGATKYDVVVSHPFGNQESAENWVRGFADEGYHTTVAFIAVHNSISLLSIADRYQVSRDEYGYGRWVERGTHDRFYEAIPDVAHHLESHGLVDSMYVATRDNAFIYQNHRGADGHMSDPLGARELIIAERSRPPTQAETDHFDSRVAYLDG
ncbi:zeta toxin family protein [Nocardiopsis oceani]